MQPAPTPTELLPDAPERARIVAAARALYLQQGIAAVSMGDIGRHLRMPEHAVCRWFPGKAPLVMAVVEAHTSFIQAELARHKEYCTSAVEELLMLRNWISAEMNVSLSPFFRQLATDYPDCQQRWQGYMASFPVAHMRTNLHWGISQGLYHHHLDVELRVADWFEQVGALGTPEATGLEISEARRTLMATFLASIATPAGALVVRRLQEAAPFY